MIIVAKRSVFRGEPYGKYNRRQISLGAVGTEGILLVIEICPGTACSVLQRTPAERACFVC